MHICLQASNWQIIWTRALLFNIYIPYNVCHITLLNYQLYWLLLFKAKCFGLVLPNLWWWLKVGWYIEVIERVCLLFDIRYLSIRHFEYCKWKRDISHQPDHVLLFQIEGKLNELERYVKSHILHILFIHFLIY